MSLGLPIIFEDNKTIIGEYFYVPNPKNKNIVSSHNIDIWANSGWVDMRKKNIKYWQSVIKKILSEPDFSKEYDLTVSERNRFDIDNPNIGEVLGYVYSMLGGQRKSEFLL